MSIWKSRFSHRYLEILYFILCGYDSAGVMMMTELMKYNCIFIINLIFYFPLLDMHLGFYFLVTNNGCMNISFNLNQLVDSEIESFI